MKSVSRFLLAVLGAGACYWVVHQLAFPDDRSLSASIVSALGWGVWMTAFLAWISRREKAGKSTDSPLFCVVAGLGFIALGVACWFEPVAPGGSRDVVATVGVTCLGIFLLVSGVQGMRDRKITDTGRQHSGERLHGPV
jgi:hypothetical protein